tara:strand:+ start:5645 stop:6298 length:654 start_codon:yes stop_codon:yes gene_type:complete
MAFQIKKDLHFGTGIYLELLDDLTNAEVKVDKFDNTKYIIPIKHIGNDSTDGGGLKWFQNDQGEWVTLKDGKTTDMEISEALYKKLVNDYSKGSKVQVTMTDVEGKMGKFTGYNVKSLNGEISAGSSDVSTNGVKAVDMPKKVVTNGSLGITWGMSINNATQLMIAKGLDNKTDIIEELEKIASKIMDVAVNGLTRWEKEQYEKDQNSNPNDDGMPY